MGPSDGNDDGERRHCGTHGGHQKARHKVTLKRLKAKAKRGSGSGVPVLSATFPTEVVIASVLAAGSSSSSSAAVLLVVVVVSVYCLKWGFGGEASTVSDEPRTYTAPPGQEQSERERAKRRAIYHICSVSRQPSDSICSLLQLISAELRRV